MTDAAGGGDGGAALQALMAMLSPAWPVGAFAYSHGLEQAVADGAVADRDGLTTWLEAVLRHGSGRNDAILLAASMRDPADPEPAEMARALAGGAERVLETTATGAAFARVTEAAFGGGGGDAAAPYPVAVGHAAAGLGLDAAVVAPLYLQAFAANLISAAVRLVPLGQTDGALALATLLPVTRAVAAAALAAQARDGLDALGGSCFAADIAAMRHETKPVRLFRT